MNKKTTLAPIFIGSAWPYANGSLHLGHVAGLIGADFLARYYRNKGNSVLFVSGSDCHGTPIEVRAEQEKTTPQKIASKYHREFRHNLIDQLGFSYDLFTKTTTSFHAKKVQTLFLDLYKKGYIYKKTQSLPFCEKCQRFLPDRYIEGECPVCHFKDARGDQCDECGVILDARDLIDPRCKNCGSKPIWKDSVHFFLKLSSFQKEIIDWVKSSTKWRINAKNFTLGFLKKELLDRAITRDSEWGIPIPLKGYEGKTIYVWFEAVCGYLTASMAACTHSKNRSQPILTPDWQKFWQSDKCLHYYVHGKDNIPFHTIVWPAILMGLEKLNLPDIIVSSEYLTFEGRQFSKSRHWGVWLPDFLDKHNADTLRYYLGINGPENSDTDFSWKEYQVKTNSELIGKFGNFINRTLNFLNKNFESTVPDLISPDKFDKKVLDNCDKLFKKVGEKIESTKFQSALKEIIKFSEDCNRYIDQKEPWKTIKTNKLLAGNTLYVCVQAVSALQLLSSPFLPFSAEKIRRQLNIPSKQQWELQFILSGHKINKAQPIFERVDL